jgi:hypothetical protein
MFEKFCKWEHNMAKNWIILSEYNNYFQNSPLLSRFVGGAKNIHDLGGGAKKSHDLR